MVNTSINLLKRLREPHSDAAWSRFVELYTPLMFYWSRQHGLNGTDSADLVQEILALLVTKLTSFEYDSSQRFRGWLHTVTLNKARDWNRRHSHRPKTDQSLFLEQIPASSRSDAFDEREYRAFLVERAKQLIAEEFEPITWTACWKYVAEDRSAAEVAAELGISPNAVRVAKCRVLKRLRDELAGLLE
jgi:RNA polymerase sigma-70 factor (ECF subfamily)